MRRFIGSFLVLPALALSASAQSVDLGDQIRFARSIVVASDEQANDVVCFACSIQVDGEAWGDAVAIGGSVRVNGRVEGDAVAVGGSLTLGPESEVGGDATVVGGSINRRPGASVGGEVSVSPGLPVEGLLGILVFLFLLSLVTHVVLALIAFLLAGEQRVKTMGATLRTHAGLTLLAGLGAVVGACIVCFIALFLGPFMLIVFLLVGVAFLLTLIVGYTGLSFWLGRVLAPASEPLVAVLLGAALITLLQLFPIVFPVFALLALGIALVSGFGTAMDWLPKALAGQQPALPPPQP